MRLLPVLIFFLFGSNSFASETLHLKIMLVHVSPEHSGWKVSQELDIPYSTPMVLTSSIDESSGVTRILKVEPTKVPNGLVSLKIQYLQLIDGTENLIQDARIITKLGESAKIGSGSVVGEHNEKITIKVSPSKAQGY